MSVYGAMDTICSEKTSVTMIINQASVTTVPIGKFRNCSFESKGVVTNCWPSTFSSLYIRPGANKTSYVYYILVVWTF